MARQRKVRSASIPLVPPSQASYRPRPSKPLIEISDDETRRLINQSGILDSQPAALESPSVMTLRPGEVVPEVLAEATPLSDEIFNAILLIMPFSAILLLMEMYLYVLSDVAYFSNCCSGSLIRQQYGKTASFEIIMDRMIPGVPSMFLAHAVYPRQTYARSPFFFYILQCVIKGSCIQRSSPSSLYPATRYKQDRRMQALLFAISFTVGSRMIFLLNNASWLVNMKQVSTKSPNFCAI